MKEIPLTHGKVALVDDEDYERIARFDWMLLKKPSGNLYAIKRDESNVTTFMHVLVLGADSDCPIDHRDRNGLNNQKSNLRLCTVTQNNQNRRRFSNNKTGFKGVSPSGRRRLPFRAQIRVNGCSMFLGHYFAPEEAARAYDAAAVTHFGEFACLNFPDKE